MKLHQNKHLEKKDFSIEGERLRIVEDDLHGEVELFVDLADITNRRRRFRKKHNLNAGLAMVLGGLSFLIYELGYVGGQIALTIGVVAVFYSLAFLKGSKSYLLLDLHSGGSIVFHEGEPDDKTLEDFLEYVDEKRIESLREKHFHVDENAEPGFEINKLKWLFSEDVITEEERDLAIAQLERKDDSDSLN